MKIETETLESLAQRRRIREERLRSQAEGFREDMAVICVCDRCGAEHYRPRTQDQKVK